MLNSDWTAFKSPFPNIQITYSKTALQKVANRHGFWRGLFLVIYVLGSYYTFKSIMHNVLRYKQYNSIFTQKEDDQGLERGRGVINGNLYLSAYFSEDYRLFVSNAFEGEAAQALSANQ